MLSILSVHVFFFLYRMSYKRSRCTIVHNFSTFRFKRDLMRQSERKEKNNKYVDIKLVNNFYQCKVRTFWGEHKIWKKIVRMVCTFTSNVQTMRKIVQIFVCFSESPNFKTREKHFMLELLRPCICVHIKGIQSCTWCSTNKIVCTVYVCVLIFQQ